MDNGKNVSVHDLKNKSCSKHSLIDSKNYTEPYAPCRTRYRFSSARNKASLVEAYQRQKRWIRLHETCFLSSKMSLCVVGKCCCEYKIKKSIKPKSYYLGCHEHEVTHEGSINDRLVHRPQYQEFGADYEFIDSDDSFEAKADR